IALLLELVIALLHPGLRLLMLFATSRKFLPLPHGFLKLRLPRLPLLLVQRRDVKVCAHRSSTSLLRPFARPSGLAVAVALQHLGADGFLHVLDGIFPVSGVLIVVIAR